MGIVPSRLSSKVSGRTGRDFWRSFLDGRFDIVRPMIPRRNETIQVVLSENQGRNRTEDETDGHNRIVTGEVLIR